MKYWYKGEYYTEKPHDFAIALDDQEWDYLVQCEGCGAEIKVDDKTGKPYPVITDEIKERLKDNIRLLRSSKCFPIINRSQLWFKRLTSEQLEELDKWYQEWLDAPDTGIIPADLEWLK